MNQSQYATVDELIAFSLNPETANNFSGDDGYNIMTTALTAASSEADSYLRSQQILPLTDWDAKLKQVVCDIAAYRLFTNYGYNPDAVQNDNIMNRYRQAISWLELVSKQLIIVEYPDSSATTPNAGPWVRNSKSKVGFGKVCDKRTVDGD